MKVLTTAPTGSPEWKFRHEGKIGGSTAADILGCGRHTRKHAWAVLTGKIHEDISNLPHVQLGIVLEPVIGKLWEKRLGRRLLPSPGLLQHEDHEWMVGTPDGIDAQTGGPWEAKSVGFWRQKEWKIDVPLRVRVQCEWYSALMGNPGPVFFAALTIPDGAAPETQEESEAPEGEYNNETDDVLLWGQRDPDPAFQERAINEVGDFYEKYVVKDVEPPAQNRTDIPLLRTLHPKDNKSMLEADSDLWNRVLRWESMGKTINAMSKERKDIEATIRDALKDATWMKGTDGRYLRYAVEPRRGYTVEPTVPRIPRLMKEMRDVT